jgi:hypothetical protein
MTERWMRMAVHIKLPKAPLLSDDSFTHSSHSTQNGFMTADMYIK